MPDGGMVASAGEATGIATVPLRSKLAESGGRMKNPKKAEVMAEKAQLIAEKAELLAEIDSLNAEKSALNGRLARQEAELATARQRISSMEERISSMEERISSMGERFELITLLAARSNGCSNSARVVTESGAAKTMSAD